MSTVQITPVTRSGTGGNFRYPLKVRFEGVNLGQLFDFEGTLPSTLARIDEIAKGCCFPGGNTEDPYVMFCDLQTFGTFLLEKQDVLYPGKPAIYEWLGTHVERAAYSLEQTDAARVRRRNGESPDQTLLELVAEKLKETGEKIAGMLH